MIASGGLIYQHKFDNEEKTTMPEVTRGMQIDDAATLASLTDSFAGQIVGYAETTKDGQRKILHLSSGSLQAIQDYSDRLSFPIVILQPQDGRR